MLLTAVLIGAAALIALLFALLVLRRLGHVGRALEAADDRLIRLTHSLPATMAARQSQLASLNATTERGLWSLTSLDQRIDATTAAMRRATAGMIAATGDLERMGSTIRRARSGLKMVIRVIELRRAILG